MPRSLNSVPLGAAIPASSARRATANACGAIGSRTGQLRTSSGLPTNASSTQPNASPQRLAAPLFRHRPPGEVLHQAVHDEAARGAIVVRRACDERIGVEAGAGLVRVIVRRL